MNLSHIFNNNRVYALGLLILGGILGWLSLILMTDSIEPGIQITTPQWIGLGFTIFISIAAWVRQCFTITPYSKVSK